MLTSQNVSIYFDKVEALKDFHEAEDFLSQVPAYLLDDKEFANTCVTRFPETLRFMSDRLRHDVDLSVMAINRNFCLGSTIFDDVDFVFDSMPEDMRTNKDLNIKLIEADYWRPSFDFLFKCFDRDKDIAIALLKHNDADSLNVLFDYLDTDDILIVLKDNPSFFAWINDESLSLDKEFILKCLKVNGEVISHLDANELYDKYGSRDAEFGDLLAKTALLSENGHGFRIMDGILNVFSLAKVSDELWSLAINRSVLCLSFDNCEENKCAERFFSDQALINKGFEASIIDFFTTKEKFPDNDLMSNLIYKKSNTKNKDQFYLKQFSDMMRGRGFDVISCSGANDAVDFMLNAMSVEALREIKEFTENTFFTKRENERFNMAGFLTKDDIKNYINDEIFKREVLSIKKNNSHGNSTISSKCRKRLP